MLTLKEYTVEHNTVAGYGMSVHMSPMFHVKYLDKIFCENEDVCLAFRCSVEVLKNLYSWNMSIFYIFHLLDTFNACRLTHTPRQSIGLIDYARMCGIPHGDTAYEESELYAATSQHVLYYHDCAWRQNADLAKSLSITEDALVLRYLSGESLYDIITKAEHLLPTHSAHYTEAYNAALKVYTHQQIHRQLRSGVSVAAIRDKANEEAHKPVDWSTLSPKEIAQHLIGSTKFEFSYTSKGVAFDYVTIETNLDRCGFMSYGEVRQLLTTTKSDIFKSLLKQLSLTREFLVCNKAISEVKIDNCTLSRQKVLVTKVSWKH